MVINFPVKEEFVYKRVIYFCLIILISNISIFNTGCSKKEPAQKAFVPLEKFDPSRDAAADINAAIAEAKRTDRRVILDVGGEWCIWCHKLDAFYENNPDVKEFLNQHYVVMKVNYSKENKNEEVLSQYPRIAGYPHLFVLDSDGKLLHSQDTGELESGDHHDRDKVFNFLKEWAKQS
jgi:thioredoxin-related protein